MVTSSINGTIFGVNKKMNSAEKSCHGIYGGGHDLGGRESGERLSPWMRN